MTKTLSIIIPVYRNEGSIDQLLCEISHISDKVECNVEAVFVIDGSPDNSFAALNEKLGEQKFSSQLVNLSRNFGSFIAIRKGLEVAAGDYFAVMAADCQEPPELIIGATQSLLHNEADVVVGVREGRGDPFLYRTLSKIFWSMYRKTVVKDMPRGGVDIFACSVKVKDALLSLPETHTSLVAQLYWVGFQRKEILYTRRARMDGLKSGWTFKKRFAYMSDSIFAFTDIPVRLLLSIGIIGTFFSSILTVMVVISWAIGLIDVPGYTPLILVQLMLFTITLMGFGIVGSYTWRGFENTKARPLGIIVTRQSFEANK
ncbi:MAG TPA: glycosyltransferase family 2 protein [Acidimicrobiia bacterium]|nr:glycosyltransferase family 2 protein [Acidimicrobiia bacterium]